MKIKKEYLILGVVIAALAVYLYQRSSDRTHYTLPSLPALKAAEVTRIQIEGAGKTQTLVRKEGRWVTEPQGFTADPKQVHAMGKPKEVLTVDNHADGPYIYLRLLKEDPQRAQEVLELLKWNEGNNSGRGIGCVSWDGRVHADQFWRHYSFGNVKERPFSEIWTDTSTPLMAKLKEKKKHVTGRCAECRWLDVCGGNFRVRAEAVTGDVWAPDPACYLTDEEIALAHTPSSCEQV